MFGTIVVGCDGSEGSLAAIELAARLRDPASGRLILTSVHPHAADFGVGADTRMREQAEEILLLSERRLGGLEAERLAVAHASVAGGLNDAAEAHGADLIVLGPTHRHAIGRATGRTTVQRLLHGAPCAVAVAAARGDEPRAAVVAFDGSPESELALRAAYGLGVPVTLVWVIEPVTYMGPYIAVVDPEMETRMQASAQSALDAAAASAPEGVAVTTKVAWGSAAEVVLDVAEASGALIVAGSRGYGMLHRAIAGSVSGALLTQTGVPALVTPRAAA